MTKREMMQSSAERLARKALGNSADDDTVRTVAAKIYHSLPKRVREAA